MIIDCHSLLWPGSLKISAGAAGFLCAQHTDTQQPLPQQHLESSEPAQATIVLGFTSDWLGLEVPNDFLMDHISAQPGKMAAFAGIDPTRPTTESDIERLARKGFSGLTLSPACQGFHPADSRVLPVYQAAQEHGLPIYFMQGQSFPAAAQLEFASPVLLDEIARKFPDLKIIISHLGHPWTEQTLTLLGKNKNVYADVVGLINRPWHAYRSLALAHEFRVMDKLLFGSGFPNSTVKNAVESLYNTNKIALEAALPAIPREKIRSIIERDSLSLLGIELSGAS